MKIILPLAALGVLSTLFLIARPAGTGGNIPFELTQRAGELGVTNPSFTGVTTDGIQIVLEARQARPDQATPDLLYAHDVVAQLRLVDGAVIDITSHGADMHQKTGVTNLKGGVHLLTSTGYDLRTEQLETRLDMLFAQTTGPIEGITPNGTITAGGMRLSTDAATGNAYLLFTEGVKLIYSPDKPKE